MSRAIFRDNSRISQQGGIHPRRARRPVTLDASYFVDGSARRLHQFLLAGRPQWVEWATAHHGAPRLFRFATQFPNASSGCREEQTMSTNDPTRFSTAETHPGEQEPGLPLLVLEIRARLGAKATPEQVAAEVRASGLHDVTDEDVRQLWDEGHLPK
jgi:hypothetical protein